MGGIRKEKEGYMLAGRPASRNQKILAKEAIVGLLAKGRHTSFEIAEHFGLSKETVEMLVDDLVRAGRVVRAKERPNHITLRSSWKSG
ncbi:MAG: FeoC-like transcriptional regulator [Desulfocucumaceae bacterium]